MFKSRIPLIAGLLIVISSSLSAQDSNEFFEFIKETYSATAKCEPIIDTVGFTTLTLQFVEKNKNMGLVAVSSPERKTILKIDGVISQIIKPGESIFSVFDCSYFECKKSQIGDFYYIVINRYTYIE